jgi:hypothetical protein
MQEAEVEQLVKSLLQPKEAEANTIGFTTIYHWRVDWGSLWRGQSDAQKVCALARSFLCTGYDHSQPICSRDVHVGVSDLRFGDGQKRGLAWRLAWSVLRNLLHTAGPHRSSASMARIFKSLLQVPTSFPSLQESDHQAGLIEQAVRQNTKATMQLPLNTLEWCRLVMSCASANGVCQPEEWLSASTPAARAEQANKLLKAFERLQAGYLRRVEETGVEMGPPAKKQRRGRRKPASMPAASEGDSSQVEVEGLRFGATRITAIRNILSHCTLESFTAMEVHLCFAGNFKYSALSDQMLSWKHLWPGSAPPPENLPNEAQEVARQSTAKALKELTPKGLASSPCDFYSNLTNDEHNLLVAKAIILFEDECLHLPDVPSRSKFRPDLAALVTYRLVVQQWVKTIRPCAEADMNVQDFQELSAAVLQGDVLDKQIQKAFVPAFPLRFHLAMLPDIRAGMADGTVPSEETLLDEAEKELWQAKLQRLSLQLKADQTLLSSVKIGSRVLSDSLEWLRYEKSLEQASVCEELVKTFSNHFMPRLTIDSWDALANSVAAVTSQPLPTTQQTQGDPTSLLLVVLDFNTPNSRDALQLKRMVSALGTVVLTSGPSKCMVFALMAARPKEETDDVDDILEEEVMLCKLMKQAGFKASQRIRMNLSPPSEENATSATWDFWQDARVFFYAESLRAAAGKEQEAPNLWYVASELCRTTRISNQVPIASNQEMHVISLVNSEIPDLHVTPAFRAGQRGFEAHLTILEHLTAKSKLYKGDWLQPGDVLNILDVHPHCGDRAIASLAARNKSWLSCQLRHLVVSGVTKRGAQAADYTLTRVGTHCAKKWLSREIVLYTYQSNPNGMWDVRPTHPADMAALSPADVEKLKAIPGVYEAYQGLGKLQLKACVVHGSKVSINPTVLAEFGTAPPSIRDKLQLLEQEHQANYETLLKDMATEEPDGVIDDPRVDETANPNTGTATTDLPTYDSLAALKAAVEIVNETKSFDDKAVTILEDKLGAFYLLAKEDNHIVKRATRLGSVGSGRLAPAEAEARTNIVPFSLPNGDKTLIEVQLTTGGAEAEAEDTGGKFQRGTLYMMMKNLQKLNGMKDISITSYGVVKPSTGGGVGDRHGFSLGPMTDEQHFVSRARADTKVVSGNVFKKLATKSPLEGGIAAWMWRFRWSEVHSKLTALKPFLTISQDLRLEKNKPVKFVWNTTG